MLPRLTSFVLMFFIAGSVHAQTVTVKLAEINGHFIGESLAELLSKEPEVQQQFTVCEQHPSKPACDGLLAAGKHGKRAEVSTSNWMSFVVDGGKLVKLTTLVMGGADAVKADLTKKFGPRTSETTFPMQNAMGATWEDHLSVWDTAAVYVGLHEDNNPASQNHHFVLVVESRVEHARDHVDDGTQPSAAQNEN